MIRITISLLAAAITSAYAYDGVIVSKVGAGTMVIFTDKIREQKGEVNVGNTISIRYWLIVEQNKKPRFIAFDGSALSESMQKKFAPKIVQNAPSGKNRLVGGFYIKSSTQRQLDISISQNLWDKVKDIPTKQQLAALEKTMSREANLNVIIKQTGDAYEIVNVIVN